MPEVILKEAHARQLPIKAHHLAGVSNSGPDALARGSTSTINWSLTPTRFAKYLQVFGHSGCGPLCLHNRPPAPPVPHSDGGNSGRRPGRPPNSLGAVGLHLRVPNPEHSGDDPTGSEAAAIQGQGPPHRAPLGNPAVVPNPTIPGPHNMAPTRRLPPAGVVMSIDDILTLDHLALLSLTLSRMDTPGSPLRTGQFMRFGHDDSSVTLAPRPLFRAMNERPAHRMAPVTIPAWVTPSVPHPLCPVAALRAYVSSTCSSPGPGLWIHHELNKCLKTSDIVKRLLCPALRPTRFDSMPPTWTSSDASWSDTPRPTYLTSLACHSFLP